MAEQFEFDHEHRRWVLVNDNPQLHRTFDQKSQLHTSEDVDLNLPRAYNMENLTPISDELLEKGAEARGQVVGEASRIPGRKGPST